MVSCRWCTAGSRVRILYDCQLGSLDVDPLSMRSINRLRGCADRGYLENPVSSGGPFPGSYWKNGAGEGTRTPGVQLGNM